MRFNLIRWKRNHLIILRQIFITEISQFIRLKEHILGTFLSMESNIGMVETWTLKISFSVHWMKGFLQIGHIDQTCNNCRKTTLKSLKHSNNNYKKGNDKIENLGSSTIKKNITIDLIRRDQSKIAQIIISFFFIFLPFLL